MWPGHVCGICANVWFNMNKTIQNSLKCRRICQYCLKCGQGICKKIEEDREGCILTITTSIILDNNNHLENIAISSRNIEKSLTLCTNMKITDYEMWNMQQKISFFDKKHVEIDYYIAEKEMSFGSKNKKEKILKYATAITLL